MVGFGVGVGVGGYGRLNSDYDYGQVYFLGQRYLQQGYGDIFFVFGQGYERDGYGGGGYGGQGYEYYQVL